MPMKELSQSARHVKVLEKVVNEVNQGKNVNEKEFDKVEFPIIKDMFLKVEKHNNVHLV